MKPLRSILARLRHHQLGTREAWQDRFVVWAAACSAGLAVVGFTYMAELADRLFQMIYTQASWSLLVITPLVGVIILALTRHLAPFSAGSGIPQVIVAMDPTVPPGIAGRLVSLRIVLAKMLLGSGALAAGFSLGREGPSVQISASVMYAFRNLLSKRSRIKAADLLLAGGAAGIAATFNAPLAGIIFAIEELSRRFEERTSGLIISAIVLAGVIAISLLGNFTYFGHITSAHFSPDDLVPAIVCVAAAGILGAAFSRLLMMTAASSKNWVNLLRHQRPYLFAAACGLAVALIGLSSGGKLFGSGYEHTRLLIEGAESVPLIETLGKIAATVLSYWSGIPGGIFSPSLAIGAGIGQDVGSLLSDPNQTLVAIGMVAFLAAATQAPLTAFIIVMEMTDGHDLILVLMVSAFTASLIAKILSKPLYKTLAESALQSLQPPVGTPTEPGNPTVTSPAAQPKP